MKIQDKFDPGPGHDVKELIGKGLDALLLALAKQSAISSANKTTLFKVSGMDFPYKKPYLTIPDKKSKDQKWYITYHIWNMDKNRLVRVRDYTCNRYDDEKERRAYCKAIMKEILLDLVTGHVIWESERNKRENEEIRKREIKNMLLRKAMDEMVELKSKLRDKTRKNYHQYLKHFKIWLKREDMNGMLVGSFTETHAERFLNYLVTDKKLAPRTHNNYKSHLSTLFNDLEKHGYIKKNPWSFATKLEEGTGKNIAYPRHLQDKVIEFCELNFPEMLSYIKVMFYTYLRPNEICNIKIKNIGQYHPEKIYLNKDHSKNGHERHVIIVPELKKLFDSMGLDQYNPECYVFGHPNIMPSEIFYKPSTLSDRYTRRVLIKLGINNQGYTLYSWKHTGVIRAKLAGMTDAAIMKQGGWREITSYQSYLKSLGLEENDEFARLMPTI